MPKPARSARKKRPQPPQLALAGDRAPLHKQDLELLAEFRYLLRQFLAFSEKAAHAAGATPRQYQALLAIKGFPGRDRVSMGEFAERLCIRHHSAVGLIDRLAREQLVRRSREPTDRRQVRLQLTARAESLLGRLSPVHRSELRRLAPLLQRLLEQLQQGSA